MPSERMEFEGASGQLLSGRLERPAGRVRGHALLAHCFTCGKDSLAASRVARELARRGLCVLRFDFTGLGGSGGDFANTNFSSNIDDLVAAATHLRRLGCAPQLLVGHSLGGAAALAAAHRMPEVRAVATIGAPSDPAHVARLFPEVPAANGVAMDIELGGRTFRIQKQFIDDIAGHRLLKSVESLGRALLVLHSPIDDVVHVDHAARLFMAASHPRSFVSLDGATHLLSKGHDAAYAGAVIAAWSSRYLHPRSTALSDRHAPPGEAR